MLVHKDTIHFNVPVHGLSGLQVGQATHHCFEYPTDFLLGQRLPYFTAILNLIEKGICIEVIGDSVSFGGCCTEI
jgi:hypothetical protein